jgi:hypothetical protein
MSDPIRLTDPRSRGSPALRELIRAAQSDLPNLRRMETLALELGTAIGTNAVLPNKITARAVAGAKAAGVGSAAKLGVVTAASAAKLGVLAAVAMGLSTAVYVEVHRSPLPNTAPNRGAAVAAPVRSLSPLSALAPLSRPAAAPPPTPLAPRPQPLVPALVPTPHSTFGPAMGFTAPPSPGAGSAAVLALAPTSAPAPAPVLAPTAVIALAPVEPLVQPATNPAPSNSPNASELMLLERAADVLRANPAAALALAEEHAARFASGDLTQEREVIAIEALVRLNRRDEARDRASRFLAAFPSSAHRLRVQALVDGAPGSDHNP